MRAIPTLEGGLRIDVEEPGDWRFLAALGGDAASGATDLAGRLGNLIDEDSGGGDWREYVVPDLREAFHDELSQVCAAIERAMFEAAGGPGPVWITPDDAMAWYSALNQARLALDECHRFGQSADIDASGFPPQKAAAYARSRVYCALQGMLLEHVMR